eukprot:6046386-Alexandrium_andersonii.AAC.1
MSAVPKWNRTAESAGCRETGRAAKPGGGVPGGGRSRRVPDEARRRQAPLAQGSGGDGQGKHVVHVA